LNGNALVFIIDLVDGALAWFPGSEEDHRAVTLHGEWLGPIEPAK
jgi:hypothetical protein